MSSLRYYLSHPGPRLPLLVNDGRRLIQRIRRSRRFAKRSVDRDSRTFVDAALTPSGQRKLALLERLGSVAPKESNWTLRDVKLSPNLLRFERDDGERLSLELGKLHAPAYARTKRLSVSYRHQGELDEDGQRFVDGFVRRLTALEPSLEQEADFPRLLLQPVASQVMFYPRSGRMELRPTLACNHGCGFCNSVDRSATDNVTGGLRDILGNLDEWEKLDLLETAISGGEPTLLPDLPEVVEAFAERGYRVELQTNGMALADPAYARRLREVGLDEVLVSLHAAAPNLSDEQITGFSGGWERTVAGIDQALAHGIRVSLSHVVHRSNKTHVRDFLEFVRSRWRRKVQIRMAFVAPTGRARNYIERFVPPLEEVAPYLRNGLAYAHRKRLRVTVVEYCGVPPCLVSPWHRACEVVHADPTDYPGENHVKLDTCRSCRYDDRCPGLWKAYYEHHGDPGLKAIP